MATATQRAILVVLAAPPLLLLSLPRLRARGAADGGAADRIDVESAVIPDRCLEGDVVDVTLTIDASFDIDRVDVTLHLAASAELDVGDAVTTLVSPGRGGVLRWRIRVNRWGRRSLGHVDLVARRDGGLWEFRGRHELRAASVFPHHAPLAVSPTPRALPDRFGDHVSVSTGEGVEFIDISDFRIGDRARRINWRATARRGVLQVNRTAAERACDVVVLIDAYTDVGGRERSSLDVAVRGAVATARAYIARHDRVGLIVLGGELLWLGPQVGGRQFYRIIDSVLDVRRVVAGERPELAVIPPSALPSGALALLFTPLLDPRAEVAIHALRRRGLLPVVVDVRTADPQVQAGVPNSELATRLWRVEQRLQSRAIEDSGVPIVRWDGDEPLDVAFSKLPSRRRSA